MKSFQKKACLVISIILHLFSLHLFAESTQYYLQADAANIREKPAIDAPVIGKLRIVKQ